MSEIELDNLDELREVILEDEEPQESDVANESQELQEPQEVQESQEPQDPQDPGEVNEANEPEPVSDKEKLMRSLVSDDDEADELSIDSVRQMLDAAPRWFLSQWKMLLLCLIGIFFYITNGYQAQMEMMKEMKLEEELKDWRYRSITRISELTLLCRQSQLEQRLREQGDSTLVPSKVAPFIINVKE